MVLITFMSLHLTLTAPPLFHRCVYPHNPFAAPIAAASRPPHNHPHPWCSSAIFHHDWRSGTTDGVEREDLGNSVGSGGVLDELGIVREAQGRGERQYCVGARAARNMVVWQHQMRWRSWVSLPSTWGVGWSTGRAWWRWSMLSKREK